MRTVAVIILLSSATWSHTQELAAIDTGSLQNSVRKLHDDVTDKVEDYKPVDKLVCKLIKKLLDRSIMVSSLHCADRSDVMLGTLGNLAIHPRTSLRPLLPLLCPKMIHSDSASIWMTSRPKFTKKVQKIHDVIAHARLSGQGFGKVTDESKAVDQASGQALVDWERAGRERRKQQRREDRKGKKRLKKGQGDDVFEKMADKEFDARINARLNPAPIMLERLDQEAELMNVSDLPNPDDKFDKSDMALIAGLGSILLLGTFLPQIVRFFFV